MWNDPVYRTALGLALLFHFLLGGLLLSDHNAVPTASFLKEPQSIGIDMEKMEVQTKKIVSAVSINEKELQEAVNALKQEKEHARIAEINHQKALEKKVEQARLQRLTEERKLKQMREEAIKKARLQQQKMLEEAKKLKDLKQQQIAEEKELAQMRKQQEQIKKEQALAKQRQLEQARIAKEKAEKLAREESARKAAAAAREARILSEAEKYKILIVSAISRQWILPENIDKQLSSQFQIRLGPDGSVMDVHLVRSSGDSILDRSAQTAIYKASPLPVPGDPELFELFRNIRLTVRPENVRG